MKNETISPLGHGMEALYIGEQPVALRYTGERKLAVIVRNRRSRAVKAFTDGYMVGDSNIDQTAMDNFMKIINKPEAK